MAQFGANMARGIMPRRPGKTGRQERAGSTQQRPGKIAHVNGRRGARKNSVINESAELRPARAKKTAASVAKDYNPTAPERVAEILKRLDQLYPDVTCALTHRSAWELLVATILSAQSTDVRVNMVTPEIFKKYPTVQDFAKLEPQQLEPDIRSTGFFRNKSKSVVGAARKIVSDFGGKVPENMNDLLTLPGVARKTANVVLGTWFRKAEGVVVDTHVHRISRRLELTKNDDPKKIEEDLMQIIPREKWILVSHQVIWHGRKLCFARSPKCTDCLLENICHAEDKTWSTVERHPGAKA
jgi:endonuclease III